MCAWRASEKSHTQRVVRFDFRICAHALWSSLRPDLLLQRVTWPSLQQLGLCRSALSMTSHCPFFLSSITAPRHSPRRCLRRTALADTPPPAREEVLASPTPRRLLDTLCTTSALQQRRQLILAGALSLPLLCPASEAAPLLSESGRARLFFDASQTVNGELVPLGRVVISLEKSAPEAASLLQRLFTERALRGTFVNRVFPGEFIEMGAPGRAELGLVDVPSSFPTTLRESADPAAFATTPSRPGTVSLVLAPSEAASLARGPPPLTRFRISTGPGPCVRCEDEGIVVGRVESGLEVVTALSRAPTYTPLQSAQNFNSLAGVIGDKRAASSRANWSKPRVQLVLTETGILD